MRLYLVAVTAALIYGFCPVVFGADLTPSQKASSVFQKADSPLQKSAAQKATQKASAAQKGAVQKGSHEFARRGRLFRVFRRRADRAARRALIFEGRSRRAERRSIALRGG